MKNNQSGRSMIEMLCVLAIIGVLTIGGIKGYQYMVSRYKANKTVEAFAFILTQIRTGYSMQEDFTGISNEVAYDAGMIPEQISYKVRGDNYLLEVPWGGFLNIFPSNAIALPDDAPAGLVYGDAVIIEIGNISRQTCRMLIGAEWGSYVNSGLVGIAASSKTCDYKPNAGGPITYAGGCEGNNNGSHGLNSIYLHQNYDSRPDHSNNATYAYGIPGSSKLGIPVAPATSAKGCYCIDNDENEVSTCSFAIKIYAKNR